MTPGVVVVPESSVHQSIKAQVDDLLQGVMAGKTMAVLNVRTTRGVNLAVAHKFDEHWQVVLWVGKSGWHSPLRDVEGAVSVAYSR